jgi:hypothetical protein
LYHEQIFEAVLYYVSDAHGLSRAGTSECLFINAVPKLFAWGEIVEDMCFERRRAEACVD